MLRSYTTLGILLLLLCLNSPLLAQQIFIKNQPFAGGAFREGGTIWVELAPTENALNFKVVVEKDGIKLSGQLLRTKTKGERIYLSLSQVAALCKATIRENSSLGIIDVYQGLKDVQDDGLDFDPAQEIKTSNSNEIKTAAFSFTVPEDMQCSRDPRIIKTFLGLGQSASTTSKITYDALVSYKSDSSYSKGAAVLSWSSNTIPKALNGETAIASYLHEVLLGYISELNLTSITGPEPFNNQGQGFLIASGQSMNPPYFLSMIVLRIDPAKKRFYTVLCGNLPANDQDIAIGFAKLLKSVQTR